MKTRKELEIQAEEKGLISQEKVWDNIAPEWHEYKKFASVSSLDFLKRAHGNVLDLGSGSGRHMTKIKNGKTWMQDISSEMLKLAKDKSEKLEIDIETIHSSMNIIPIENEFFDFAICVSALHCVEGEDSRKKSVKELYRVMKKGGEAYIGVWNYMSKRFDRKRKNGKDQLIGWSDKGVRYYYLFEENEVHDLFKSAGFQVVSSYNSEMMINFIVKK